MLAMSAAAGATVRHQGLDRSALANFCDIVVSARLSVLRPLYFRNGEERLAESHKAVYQFTVIPPLPSSTLPTPLQPLASGFPP